jgi:Double-GTPase 2
VSTIDQMLFRAPRGSGDTIARVATSLWDLGANRTWQETLLPWLRAGRPLGRCYVNFGSRAVAIRWRSDAERRYDWQYAGVLLGESTVLTPDYLLELPELRQPDVAPDGRLRPVARVPQAAARADIARRAREADARELFAMLFGQVLEGRRNIVMPWPGPGLPEAALWGLLDILSMLGDTEPLSYLSYAAARTPVIPGLFISFRPGAAPVPADKGVERVAREVINSYAQDPDALRLALGGMGFPQSANRASRIAQVLRRWPLMVPDGAWPGRASPATAPPPTPARPVPRVPDTPAARITPVTPAAPAAPVMPVTPVPAVTPAAPPPARDSGGASKVQCPFCLGDIPDWDKLDRWQWKPEAGEYEKIEADDNLSEAQRRRVLGGAQVRCPFSSASAHYLPVDYGRFGEPVHLGFVGVTKSGKSHLLSAIVHAIEERELEPYGIRFSPLDHALHQRFVGEWVAPLFDHDKVLPDTSEALETFVDAFLVSHNGGVQRPIVLFDVAGGVLSGLYERDRDKAPPFLSIASGLFFIIAPEHVEGRRSSDAAFSNVLDRLQEYGRLDQTNAVIVLNKADMLRFEPRIARWLRAETNPLDLVELLRESADLYGYLRHRRPALNRPYQDCARATIHVASPTGGSDDGSGTYPRGVTPRRVINPLVAMLAMTGLLSGPWTGAVGA